MYKTEQAFSKQVLKVLQERYRMVLRVESGETSRGFPDIYCVKWEGEQWFELKNCPRLTIKSKSWTIPWRVGQQAWHLKYYYASAKKRWVVTLVALSDGYLFIPMTKKFEQNKVTQEDCVICKELNELC